MEIVIAEDAALLREGLTRLLTDRGHEVVAAVGDAPALLAAVRDHRPDIAVVDVRMPPDHRDDGVRAAHELRSGEDEPQPVLVLSQYVEERYAAELLANDTGGFGYLLKDRIADVGDFLAALERVAAGGTALDPEVVSQIPARNRRRSRLDALTEREREVLAAMAEGLTNPAIADRLVLTLGAVEKHVSNIFTKLDLPADHQDHRRVRAVLAWLGHDVPGPSGPEA